MKSFKLLLAATVAAGALIAPAASAQDEAFSLSANAAITSDYRFRGFSLSDKDFAIQGGMDLETSSGFYAGTWGSSIEQYAGSEMELDLYGGYATEIGGLGVDVGLLAYLYPGSSSTTYLETYASVGGAAGVVEWAVGVAYAWDQDNIGGTDNLYLYVDAGMPIADTPLSLSTHFGYEDGAFGNDKTDWSVGFSYDFEQFSLGVAYIDTANVGAAEADATVVGTLSASF